jgi:hypothetical protein
MGQGLAVQELALLNRLRPIPQGRAKPSHVQFAVRCLGCSPSRSRLPSGMQPRFDCLKAVDLSDPTRDALDCAGPNSHSFAAVVQAECCFALILPGLAPAA